MTIDHKQQEGWKMHTEAYQTYKRLREELNGFISHNLGYSPAAQKVKNLMRELWPQLSKTEREECTLLLLKNLTPLFDILRKKNDMDNETDKKLTLLFDILKRGR